MLHPALIKQEMRAAGTGAWLMMHGCSACALLASNPFTPAMGWGACPKQTFTWDSLLLSGLFLGEDTWIINFPCALSEFVILLSRRAGSTEACWYSLKGKRGEAI